MTRALAINALMRQPTDTDEITLAGDRVFDSMLDPLQFDKSKKDIPAIIVYTDEDDSELIARASGGGPYRRFVTLRVEIVLGSFDEVVKDDQTFVSYGLPMTDAQLECRLDLFEQQVRWALFGWPRAATFAFQTYVVRLHSISSHVQRDESGNNRLAARVLCFKLEIKDDCPPVHGIDEGDTVCDKTDFKPEDFEKLPGWLRTMLVASQNMPSMRPVLEALGATGNCTILLPILSRVGWGIDMIEPAAQALLVEQGKTMGPDGRIEIQAMWTIGA